MTNVTEPSGSHPVAPPPSSQHGLTVREIVMAAAFLVGGAGVGGGAGVFGSAGMREEIANVASDVKSMRAEVSAAVGERKADTQAIGFLREQMNRVDSEHKALEQRVLFLERGR